MEFSKYKISSLGTSDKSKFEEHKYINATISCISKLETGKVLEGYLEIVEAPNGAILGMVYFNEVILKEI